MSSIIKKGSPIPYDNTEQYHTLTDDQEMVEIEVYEGESQLVKDNNLLGTFKITNLPKRKAGEVIFDVNFKIDSNGILTVTAQLKDNKDIKNQLLVETYKGGVSKNVFNLIDKEGKINSKDNKFIKMRDLRIEMDKYYEQIINPQQNIEDENEDEDEEEKLKRKEEERFDLINNYSHAIEEFISLFENKDLQNEAILEKVFIYLRKLFESYKMALSMTKQVTDEFKKKTINKINGYFTNLYEYKIFWLEDLLSIFEGLNSKIFFDIAVHLMQLFMFKGQIYITEAKTDNFNKYYSKIYYKGALEIVRKYNLDRDLKRIERKKQDQYIALKNKCLAGINNLNAEFKIQTQNSLSSNKLVSDELKNEKEKLYLILDSFHENINKLEGVKDEESSRIISFSYANIVKIEYKLLRNKTNLHIIRDYGNKCQESADAVVKNKSWYKEFLKIQNELEEEIKMKDLEKTQEKIRIKEEMKDELNKISNLAKEKSRIDFIKYIIDNYPPIGYKKEDDYVKRYKENPEKTLEDLTTAYHTSNYHGKDTTYEKYLIVEQIETELNKMKINKEENK